jgi:lysophospholipase L1-like esterase
VVNWRPECKNVNDYVMRKIQTLKPHHIFLHANWALYKEQDPAKNIYKTINYIRSASPNSEITIVGAVPQWSPTLPNFMLRRGLTLNGEQYFKNSNLKYLKIFDKEFYEVAKKENVKFFSAISAFCLNDNCKITTSFDNKIMPTTWDYGHLTKGGSVLLARRLLEKEVLLNSKTN